MLRLNPKRVHYPTTLDEVLTLLDQFQDTAKLCAGGTDLLPNLKHELYDQFEIIHLAHLKPYQNAPVIARGNELTLAANARLNQFAQNPLIQSHARGLALACAQIASPQIQRMGTLGGNLCLDTRCLYYNQSHFWRESLGFCLKKCGDTCHVTVTGKRCVAAASNDGATALLSLQAEVTLQSKQHSRRMKLDDFFKADGQKNTQIEANEILTHIHIPMKRNAYRTLSGFSKIRHRNSIDFPLISMAICISLDVDDRIASAFGALNAITAKPKLFEITEVRGNKWDSASRTTLADTFRKRATPVSNICSDPAWRKAMAGIYCTRMLESLAGGAHVF